MPRVVGRSLAGVALLLALVGGPRSAHAQPQAGPAYVTRAVDGDTLYAELGGRLEAVRYLGVNTPRIEHPTYGAERYATLAREANRRLVEGKWVRLVFEGATRDRHGRLLAYVWSGNTFVNAALVHYGYGEAATASTAGYAAYFRTLEEGAQRDGRGVWRDRDAQTYHRPRPTELAADTGEHEDALTVSGGRVFSAPAPFLPPAPSASSSGFSGGVPAGPVPPAPRMGPPSSGAPRGAPRGSIRY
jgi:micrococcal nuclease